MKLMAEIRLIKTDLQSLRSFAWIVGGIFIGIGVLTAFKHGNWINSFSILGATLLILGLLIPAWLKPIYLFWMTLGLLMGLVMAPVMFGLLFYIAVTPVALLARACGKSFLDLEFRKGKPSYWIAKPKKQDIRKSADNQF